MSASNTGPTYSKFVNLDLEYPENRSAYIIVCQQWQCSHLFKQLYNTLAVDGTRHVNLTETEEASQARAPNLFSYDRNVIDRLEMQTMRIRSDTLSVSTFLGLL